MGILAGLFLVFCLGASLRSSTRFARNAVGVVEIKGGIYEPEKTLALIHEFSESDGIRGVIVRIDSPGGTVAASQELYQAIHELSLKKPVIASMGSLAASGGYYAACGAHKIIANPGTITGSIGVRIEHIQIGDLLEWAKIHYETLKSGQYKDMISLHQALTPEERALVDQLLAEVHDQFKKTVAECRKLDLAKVNTFADGRILSGTQALKLGLVDQLGGFATAVKAMQAELQMKEEPKLIYGPGESAWWVKLLSGEQHVGMKLESPSLQLLYQM